MFSVPSAKLKSYSPLFLLPFFSTQPFLHNHFQNYLIPVVLFWVKICSTSKSYSIAGLNGCRFLWIVFNWISTLFSMEIARRITLNTKHTILLNNPLIIFISQHKFGERESAQRRSLWSNCPHVHHLMLMECLFLFFSFLCISNTFVIFSAHIWLGQLWVWRTWNTARIIRIAFRPHQPQLLKFNYTVSSTWTYAVCCVFIPLLFPLINVAHFIFFGSNLSNNSDGSDFFESQKLHHSFLLRCDHSCSSQIFIHKVHCTSNTIMIAFTGIAHREYTRKHNVHTYCHMELWLKWFMMRALSERGFASWPLASATSPTLARQICMRFLLSTLCMLPFNVIKSAYFTCRCTLIDTMLDPQTIKIY